MINEPTVPTTLKKTLSWFGKIISRPIDIDSKMNPISPSGRAMSEEACEYIAPSPTLKPDQRIQLYNQQYWWRLLSCLQENFPLVTRLFGYADFNQTIAIPYLVKYWPNTWTLNDLGNRLPDWIMTDYLAEDQELVFDAARLDLAYNQAFVAAKRPVPDNLEAIAESRIYLQPFIHLFRLKYDLNSFRKEMLLQNPDYWIDHDFPTLQHKPTCLLLRRSLNNQIAVDIIEDEAYAILSLFKNGATIDEVCTWIEEQGEPIASAASEKLHLWFQEWTLKQCLTSES